ncbi:MAG: S8 family serine peptidase [Candidatus Bathyarchaeota archaeon]|nr:S8 family serine peptidase [Candidatus Bathyarchaeota archaeon]
MNIRKISSLTSLLLIALLMVSSNLAAANTITAANNNQTPPICQQNLTSINHPGEIQNAASLDSWSNQALSAFVDSQNAIEIIVGVDGGVSDQNKIASLAAKYGGDVTGTVSMGAESALVIKTSASTASSFVSQIQSLGSIVKYVEPNGKYSVASTPNDQYWSLQWGLRRVGADYAWNTTVGSGDLLVAVIDTGVDYTHPDLQANYVGLGYDFVNNDSDPLDDFGHGTHCAGIIAATVNNTIGIAGVAQVKIMAEKGLGAEGSGSYVSLANCIINATDAGADIISNSWGGSSASSLIEEAINYAIAHGALVIAAAGNENTDQPLYPAAYNGVVAVAASNVSDTKASFSNYGSWVDVSAPGVMIYSTMPTYHVTMNDQPRFTTTYSYANGTSMACPVAAGVAALIWSRYPSMTAEFVREQLEATCDDAGTPGFDNNFGYGIVNAQRGIEEAPVAHDLAAATWVKPSFAMLDAAQSFNLTVLNRGLMNETNVQISLLVNGSTVDSTSILALAAYRAASVVLSWTPSAVGTYNVTYSVTAANGESNFANNYLSTTYAVVSAPSEAGWTRIASQMDYDFDTCNVKAVYSQLMSGGVFFKVEYYRPWNESSTDLDVAIMLDVDQNISTGTPQDYYPFQNNSIGSDFLIIVGKEGNQVCRWDSAMRQFDFNNPMDLLYLDAPDGSTFFVVGVSAENMQATGVMDCSLIDLAPIYYQNQWWVLWNWVPGSGYFPFAAQPNPHDLVVTLETPRFWTPQTALTVTAKVFNLGQTSEANVNLQLRVDGEVVNSSSFASVGSGEYKMATYTWLPTTGHYNISAYVVPITGESSIANNLRSRLASVSQKIAVISDNNELWQTLNILDSMNINYDYGNDNEVNQYTADINVLGAYPAVIYYNAGRNITAQEQTALNQYLAEGGNLLVTGLDSLLNSDAKLADVLRVTASGSDVISKNVTVVDSTHPIVNGGYGSFGIGYGISGLSADNDAVEADTHRNAKAIIELTDGHDKIVAADSLPGKVVYWNGMGTSDWLGNADCTSILKNTLLWFGDVSAPTTTDDYNGEWWIADFTINLSATDYFGVNQTYYRINEGATQTVATDGQPRITTESANNTLEYWSTDIAGNTELHHVLSLIKLDKTGPVGTLQISGSGYVTSTDITLTLTANDPISGIAQVRYSNDGVWDTEKWEQMNTTKAWTLTAGEGNKTVYCALRNNAGITSVISAWAILDTVHPNGSIVINGGANYTNTAQANLTLTLTDDNTGAAWMRFSNDNSTWSNWQAFASAAFWNLSSLDGAKTVFVQFRDAAGLTSIFTDTIILDATPPTANAGVDQTVTVGDSVTLSGAGSADNSNITSYSWAFGDNTQGNGVSVTHTYSSAGVYSATLTVTDAAGNTASDTAVVTVNAKASSSSSSSSTSTTPIPTATPKPTASPTPTEPSIQATNDSGANVTLNVDGDIAASQISDAAIHVDQAAGTTSLSFTVSGEDGTSATGTITIPKSQVPQGTEPTIYIDGVKAENQSYTQDASNYYVTYTVHFSTHTVSIVFSGAQPTQPPTQDYTLLVAGAVLAAIVCLVAVLVLRHRGKSKR